MITLRQLARIARASVETVLILIVVFSSHQSKTNRDDDSSSIEIASLRRRLENGLEDLSDSDRRSLGFASVDPSSITLEQAQLARQILDKLPKRH